MTERILLIAAAAFACIYGMVRIRRGLKDRFFAAALCGLTALLLSRLYYLILVLSNGNDEILTIGTLGQASAYLFFLTADIRLFSDRVLQESRNRICLPGLFAALAADALFLAAAFRVRTPGAFIGEGIYIACMGSALFYAVKVISCRRKSKEAVHVYLFNICVCILAFSNAASELLGTFEPGLLLRTVTFILTCLSALTVAAMPVLFRKGAPHDGSDR